MAQILPQYGQTTPTTSAPGTSNSLPGQTYEGAFSNSVASIPLIGGGLNDILTSLYGSKPATENPVASANQAIIGNTQNLPADANLTLGTDTLSAQGAALPFEQNLPGYEGLLNQGSSNAATELSGNVPDFPGFTGDMNQAATNTAQELQGQLPQDVIDQISQAASERGVGTGQGQSSPNTSASYLQSLGLNSLSQEQTGLSNLGTLENNALNIDTAGQNALSQLIGETPTGQQFNPSTMYVTPSQQQAADQAANQIAAAPDPEATGLYNTIMGFI